MKIKSLTTRISLVVTLLTILVLLATIMTEYFSSRKSLEQQAKEETQYKLDLMVQSLSKVQASVESTADFSIPALCSSMADTARVMRLLSNIVKKNPYVSSAAVAYAPNYLPGLSYFMPIAVNREKVYNFYGNKDVNGEYCYNEWYMVPTIKGEPFWTDPYSNDVNESVVSYAVPIQSETKGCLGVLTLSIELKNFVDKLIYRRDNNELDEDHAQRNQHILLDRNTTFLTTPHSDYIMNETLFTLAEEHSDSTYSYIGHEIIAGRNGQENIVIDGKLSVVTWRILPNLQWTALVITPYAEVFASLRELTVTTIIVALVGVILAVLVLIFSVNRTLRPLKRLHDATKQVEEGKYDAKLPECLTNRPDEIGVLGREFVLMAQAVQSNVNQLEMERKLVKDSNDMLTNLIHNVVRNLQMPINNMISFTDGLAMLVDNSEEAQVIKGEAEQAGKTVLQQFLQLNEMATLISSGGEDSDTMVVVRSGEFIDETKKSIRQLEERFFITIRDGHHEERQITMRTNPNHLERLIYLLIVEVSKVSHSSVVEVGTQLNEEGTALRYLISSESSNPIGAAEKADFFTHFAKQKISAEADSDYLQLYICYRTAEQLGAHLYVDTKYIAGNCFILECPQIEE